MESIATKSISDFKSKKSNIKKQTTYKKNDDLLDTFICHIIVSMTIFLYLIIDLAFGSLKKND